MATIETDIPQKIIEEAVLSSDGNMDQAIDYVCIVHPDAEREEIKNLIKFYRRSEETKLIIYKEDIFYAQSLNNENRAIEYLCKTYPFISRKKIQKAYDKMSQTKKSKEIITEDDVNEALEFYNFAFGPGLTKKVVRYLGGIFDTITERQIIDQLNGYDFGETRPISPTSTLLATPLATPPRRGSTYHPADFSPSSMGACSVPTMDFLKEKRTKHLPYYVSPPRSTRTASRPTRQPTWSPLPTTLPRLRATWSPTYTSPSRSRTSSERPLRATWSPTYTTPSRSRTSNKRPRLSRSPSEESRLKRLKLSF